MRFHCRIITKGYAEGEALVSKEYLSFLGGVNKNTGIIEAESDIRGKSVADKILIFPGGKGSTVGTYVLLNLKKRGVAPKAIINKKTESIIAVGTAIARIPLVDSVDDEFFRVVETGDRVIVDARKGFIELVK